MYFLPEAIRFAIALAALQQKHYLKQLGQGS
jgi:hypothetical protein